MRNHPKKITCAERIFNIPTGLLEDSINKFIKVEFGHDPKDYMSTNLNNARRLI